VSAEQFEIFFNGIMKKDAVPPDDDRRLYKIAEKYGVPSVLIRVMYFMWRRDRNPVTILDCAEKR
jgi:hypothetical protein